MLLTSPANERLKQARRVRDGREPESGVMLAADTVAALYAGYVSAHARGAETDIPLV